MLENIALLPLLGISCEGCIGYCCIGDAESCSDKQSEWPSGRHEQLVTSELGFQNSHTNKAYGLEINEQNDKHQHLVIWSVERTKGRRDYYLQKACLCNVVLMGGHLGHLGRASLRICRWLCGLSETPLQILDKTPPSGTCITQGLGSLVKAEMTMQHWPYGRSARHT